MWDRVWQRRMGKDVAEVPARFVGGVVSVKGNQISPLLESV